MLLLEIRLHSALSGAARHEAHGVRQGALSGALVPREVVGFVCTSVCL